MRRSLNGLFLEQGVEDMVPWRVADHLSPLGNVFTFASNTRMDMLRGFGRQLLNLNGLH